MAIPGQRSRNIYNPKNTDPFKISRSKIELFTECPRCFYLDRRLGIARPPGFPFTLNSAVDTLLKKEFDVHRAHGTRHPLMEAYGIDAVPFQHDMMDEWRENFKGIQFFHRETNLIVTGAVDDVWVNPKGELIVVDYKATSTEVAITLDAEYRSAYKRQVEIYQWLFRMNGFPVSNTSYFVYANGNRDRKVFDAKLEFNMEILSYTGNDSWIESILKEIAECLKGELPNSSPKCDYCRYNQAAMILSGKHELTIEELIVQGEGQAIEFKNGITHSEIGKTLTAFFNTNIGIILIGITDKGEVSGINGSEPLKTKDEIQKNLFDIVSEIEPCSDHIEITFESLNGKTVAKIHTKICPSRKLHYFKGNAYKRVLSSNRVMSAGEINDFLKQNIL